MTMQSRWADGPDIGTPPTSTDHLIDVLERLRWELEIACDENGWPEDAFKAAVDADAILKTYGR